MNKLTAIALFALTAALSSGCAVEADDGSDVGMATEAADVELDIDVDPVAENALEIPFERVRADQGLDVPTELVPAGGSELDIPTEPVPEADSDGARTAMSKDGPDNPAERHSLDDDVVEALRDHCGVGLDETHPLADRLADLRRESADKACKWVVIPREYIELQSALDDDE